MRFFTPASGPDSLWIGAGVFYCEKELQPTLRRLQFWGGPNEPDRESSMTENFPSTQNGRRIYPGRAGSRERSNS